MFQWGVVFQMGGFIFKWVGGGAPVLMGVVSKKFLDGDAFPIMGNPDLQN